MSTIYNILQFVICYNEQMRKSRLLKSQDIIILGKLTTDEQWPTQKDIAETLQLSQAEISHALQTLEQVGLINIKNKKVNKLAVSEFIIHALKFFYPVEKKGIGRGVLIGPSSHLFRNKVNSDEYNYVWPDSKGSEKGVIVTPLIDGLAKLVTDNERLFLFLNVVEIFRGLGGVRHIQEAQKMLKDILK